MSDPEILPPTPSEQEVPLRMSLRSLQSQYPQTQVRFTWFGVLPEAATITPPMMAVVWQAEVNDVARWWP